MRPEHGSDRLAAVFESHYDNVWAYCARSVGVSNADDAVAEVFEVALRKEDAIDLAQPLPWLYRVAHFVVSNKRRALSRQLRLVRRVAGLGGRAVNQPDEMTVRREADALAVAALRGLGPADQEILMLAAWEELSAREIADVLGISESAAAQRLYRAKRRFAGALGKSAADGGVR